MPSPTRHRWRPRFSLLTLLLSVLFCGSGMLLWKNRIPWAVLTNIRTVGSVRAANFSQKGNYFYVASLDGSGAQTVETLSIYDSGSGECKRSISHRWPNATNQEVVFSSGEKYLLNSFSAHSPPFTEAWNIATGEPLDLCSLQPPRFQYPILSPRDHFAVLLSEGEITLVKLPSLAIVQRLPAAEWHTFSPDEKWLMYKEKSPYPNIVLVSTATGMEEKHFPPGSGDRPRFLPDNKLLAIPFKGEKRQSLTSGLFDIESEQEIQEVEGRVFSNAGVGDKYFVTGENDTARIYSVASRKLLLEFTDASPSFGGDCVLLSKRATVLDIPSGMEICIFKEPMGALTHDGEYARLRPAQHDSNKNDDALFNVKNGALSHSFRLKKDDPVNTDFFWEYNPHPRRLLSFFSTTDKDAFDPRYHQVQLWHRRRPEEWWGIIYFWECWLVLALFVALAVSILKRPRSSISS